MFTFDALMTIYESPPMIIESRSRSRAKEIVLVVANASTSSNE